MSQTDKELERQVHNRVAKATNSTQMLTVDGATHGIMKLIVQRDETLKQKLLEALPEEHDLALCKKLGHHHAESYKGYNQALSDITQAIEQVYGDG